MSRTFIFRHEDVFPQCGRKTVEHIGVCAEDKVRDGIFRQVSSILGTPLRTYPHKWWSRFTSGITKAEWDLFNEIEENTIYPIRGPWWHPARLSRTPSQDLLQEKGQ